MVISHDHVLYSYLYSTSQLSRFQIMLPKQAQTWSGPVCAFIMAKLFRISWMLHHARKQQMDISLASATVISWACTNTARIQAQDSHCENLEGFVHALTLVRLGLL
jgi:hypothetical protein